MPKLNNRQQAQIAAIANFKTASRGVVIQVEATLTDYVTSDSFNPHNLEFFLNAMSRSPRLQSAFKKMLPMYAPVTVKGSGNKFKVTNVENMSKKQKVKARSEIKKLIALELNSLLSHPSIKVNVEFDWSKKSESLTKQMFKLMKDNGITTEQLNNVVSMADQLNKADKTQGEPMEAGETPFSVAS